MSEPTHHLSEADERPWEQPGSWRMDSAPHRGNLLMLLGNLSWALGFASFLVGLPATLVALPLGLMTFAVAQQDVKKMRASKLDVAGRGQTEAGGDRGLQGALLSMLGSAVWAAVCTAFLLGRFR